MLAVAAYLAEYHHLYWQRLLSTPTPDLQPVPLILSQTYKTTAKFAQFASQLGLGYSSGKIHSQLTAFQGESE